jgi:hypothetical protein
MEDERTPARQHPVEEGDEVELPPEHPDHRSIPVRAGKREPNEDERATESSPAGGK